MINESDLLFGGLTILGVMGMLFIGWIHLSHEAPTKPMYNDSKWISDNPNFEHVYQTYECNGTSRTDENGYLYCVVDYESTTVVNLEDSPHEVL